MASSGNKSVKVTNWDTLQFEWWENSQNVASNLTTIGWQLVLYSGSNGRIDSSASKPWAVTVNGTKYSGTTTVGIANNSSKVLASRTTTIAHNADGTKTFSYSFSQEFDINFNGWIGTISGEGSGTLDTIPRASQPSCITWPEHTQNVGDFGDTISIHMNRASSAFTHTVRYQFGSQSGTIATGVTTGTTWAIPKSLMNLIPNSTSGSGTIYVDTYNGSTKIGTKSCGFTVTVPTTSDCYPVANFTLEDTTGWDEVYGSPVQGLSKIKITVNPALAYGSPIASYEITADGLTATSASATTDFLKKAGDSVVKVTVKDKRGRPGTASYTMKVQAYARPNISRLAVHRVDADGNEDDQGEKIRVSFAAAITPLNNKNTATYTLRYKKSTATSYAEIKLAVYNNVYSIVDGGATFPADSNSSYDVEIVATDSHDHDEKATSASTAFTLVNWGADGKSMGIFKVAEKPGYLEIGQKVEVENPLELEDGGKKLLTLTADYKNYGGSAGNQPWCRKTAAGMVELWGVVSPANATNAIGQDTAITICTMPAGYRPAQGFYALCQGSGNAFWMLSVASDGTVGASRHRVGDARSTPSTNSWMPFHATFIADN